ncbi:hypothetical protein [Kaarinaea lacus]
MRKVQLLFMLLLPPIILGCQNAPSTTDTLFSGKSSADSVLKKDTLNTIMIFVLANDCNRIDHIETSVLHFDPRNGIKNHVWSKEKWVVTGCGKTFPFYVTYSEDGGSGSFFEVSEKDTD